MRMWAERGRASHQQVVAKLRRGAIVSEVGKTGAMIRHLALLLLLGISIPCGQSWHDFDNFQYDCWPVRMGPGEDFSPDGTVDCNGLGLEWVLRPNDTVYLGIEFVVSYRATISTDFYERFTNHSYFGSFNANQARTFCEDVNQCPDEDHQVRENTCCVHHANIHVCAPSVDFCGPWVQPGERISTHTVAEWGSINTVFETDVLINTRGNNFIIAHLRIGSLQIALGQQILVIPPPVCGDDICQPDESCSNCSVDCCPGKFPGWGIALIVTTCAGLPLTGLLAVVIWYYYQKHKLLYDESWIVNYNDIQKDHGYRGFMGSLVSFQWTPDHGPQNGDSLFNNTQKRQLFTQTGVYDGKTVAIKKIPKLNFSVTMAVRKDVRQIRELDHPNLCKFIGASVEPPNVAILTEYCPKGSLNDVLQNDEIPLNWGFRFSFARDIARAMSYLHQKKLHHGRLKSSNCIIDDRWVLKITDIGLPSFRQAGEMKSDFIHHARQQACKVYMAPEIRSSSTFIATAPADVYSYAIIMVEIATRQDPYSEDMVVNGIRPQLSELQDNGCPCPQGYLELFEKCWMHNPVSRPSFDTVKKTLHRINPCQESPVDNMMLMMEKYSKHLEVMVAERTQELLAEQKKTDQLLHSMLPPDVAKDLRQGKPADARSFDSATIYFSDIVGFTSLASQSTPMQVVNMLNELYTMFDYILDRFDVYKVETIGDAYMVVSGIPRENGINHATEIACMALEMIAVVEKFRIPHKTTEKLRIRVGIHSGPVVAGVVGTKMPRYCLFGDTVNTASRMETASEPMRIHISNSCAQLLLQAGGFDLEKRGTIQVKGKDPMVTYWLNGSDRIKQGNKHLMSPKPSVSSISTNKDFIKERDTQLDKIELPGTVCE